MNEEQMIAYLTQKAGGKLMMSPKQLATVIPCNEKQQSLLRKLERFPIRHTKDFGDRVLYSVTDVAAYILYRKITADQKEPAPLPVVTQPDPEPAPRKRRGRKPLDVENLSHVFTMKYFVTNLQREAEQLQDFADQMVRYEKSFLLKEKLSGELLSDDSDDEPQKNAL